MSMIDVAFRRRGGVVVPVTGPLYEVPTSAPYNAPEWIPTPTADGSGSVVHPGVVDIGRTWHGYRYWMAVTGYYQTNNDYENPHILASRDGWRWEPPPGLTNPVYPKPPDDRFNSDTDIEYDPRSDELVMIYREMLADRTHQAFIARSPDGVTWPAKATPLNWTRPDGGDGQVLSPSIVRVGEGDWWLFGIDRIQLQRLLIYKATEPDGPWTGPTVVGNILMPQTPWHLDVIWHEGAFRALVDVWLGEGVANDGYYAGSSVDGLTWAWSPTRIMQPSTSGWDTGETYRATFTPHENGTHYRVWYSAGGPDSWRVAYTELPTSLWPAPPA